MPKSDKSAKEKNKPIMQEEPKKAEALTIEQYELLKNQLDQFHESLLSFLAGTAQFELIPTTNERGSPLSKENLELIRKECKRLGYKVLYSIDLRDSTLVTNPETMRVVLIPNQTEMH